MGLWPGEQLHHDVFGPSNPSSPLVIWVDIAQLVPDLIVSQVRDGHRTVRLHTGIYISPKNNVGTPTTDPLFFFHHAVSDHRRIN